MAQPVRKVIKEIHPELSSKPFYTLIIDGNNLLRQSMADTKVNGNGIHYGGIFQFFLQIRMLMTAEYRYDYVYVVFDDTDSGILRYQIYNEYKANRDKNYAKHLMGSEEESDYWKRLNQTIKGMERAIYKKEQKKKKTENKVYSEEELAIMEERRKKKEIVDENFERERNLIMMYCVEMSIRVLFDDKTEGDDFIAYYVAHKKPEERVIIVSTDQDLTQLISPTVAVYNRTLKKYLNVKNFQKIKGYPVENVLLRKIFCGDPSDNIGNIKGLSENRLMELMPEIAERPVTIDEVKEKAQKMIDERVKEKKKPLQWHENIINGVSNKEYNGDFYEINEKIINLKKPLLTKRAEEDIEAMMYAPMEPDDNSFANLYQMIVRDGIENLVDANEFSRFFVPFKELADKEKKRYIEETKE
jgi:5'-3' exonuclease